MLFLQTTDGTTHKDIDLSGDTFDDVVWADLLDPQADEIAYIEQCFALHVPKLEELVEIESSSRVHHEGDSLYLSTPVMFRDEHEDLITTPVGFVLSRTILITIRYKPLAAFSDVLRRMATHKNDGTTSASIFVALVNAIVDRMADGLEHIGAELDIVAKHVFGPEAMSTSLKRPARQDEMLRETLRRVGRSGVLTSKLRDSLLGIGRIVPYVHEMSQDWLPSDCRAGLKSLQQDITSLSDYDTHLSNRVQFLLDATLGLINIEQNSIIKVLTVVSVVGVPPTLVASLYGMNFKNMPELNWAWGYPYGLALIFVSAVAPLLWFKFRGWL